MGYRSYHSKSCHNRSVARSAAGYRSHGYRVYADIPGYRKPYNLSVGGIRKRPDIIAKRGRDMKVIEWETPKSVNKDSHQHRILRTWSRCNGAHFRLRVCDD